MQQRIFIPEGLTVNHPFFYIIQHITSGKYYAGYCCYKQRCNSDKFMKKRGYQTSSKHIKNIISLEGLESFSVVRIRHFRDSSTAFYYENRFLDKVDAMRNPTFINRSNGGLSFRDLNHTEESKRKLRDALKGRIVSLETREKMGAWQIGRVLSDETKARMRLSMKGVVKPPLSDEHKDKIRKALKGKPKSAEHVKKMSEANMGKKLSPETIAKREATRKINYAIKKGLITTDQ